MKKIEARLKTSKGELIPLEDWSFRIGAFEGVCNYVLSDQLASPIHGVVEYKDNRWYIQDTNSAAGILVNGHRIEANTPVALDQNDCITIADTSFTIIMDLELFKATDVRLINDLYKNWLMEIDPVMQGRYREEILNLINERLTSLESVVTMPASSVSPVKASPEPKARSYSASASEVRSASQPKGMMNSQMNRPAVSAAPIADEGSDFTSVLSEDDGDDATSVLSVDFDDDGEGATSVLSEDDGEGVTSVLSEEAGDGLTTVLQEEGYDSTTVLNEAEDDLVTAVLNDSQTCFLERVNTREGQIEVDSNPFIIGKALSQVNYCLDERGISRRHARIFKGVDDTYFIADLDSKNGTFINGKRLDKDASVKLKDGDMVSFAEYNFIIMIK